MNSDNPDGHGTDGRGVGWTPERHLHRHGPGAEDDHRYLWLALALVAGFMAVQAAVAVVSGSLALLADAGHLLVDVGAIGGAIWASRLAHRPANATWSFGLKRAEVLAGAINGVTLLVIAVLVVVEAVNRLVQPVAVHGVSLVALAGAGVAVNAGATWVLSRADRRSLNVQGAFQHMLTDLYGFIGTGVAGTVIIATGWVRADAIASLFVAALVLRAACGLIRASGRILLEGAPDAVDLDAVRRHVGELPEVVGVHDLHGWMVTSGLPAFTAHVVVTDRCLGDGSAPRVLDQLQRCLADHFDVAHSTFQLEAAGHAGHEPGTHS